MRGRRILALAALLCGLVVSASAEKLTLPAALAVLGEDAFRGDEALTSVSFGPALGRIGAGAFADCTQLETLIFRGQLPEIGDEAFLGCDGVRRVALEGREPVSVQALRAFLAKLPKGCDIEIEGKERRFTVENLEEDSGAVLSLGPTYRALLVGETYQGDRKGNELQGPDNDIAAMSAMLSTMDLSGYSVTPLLNGSADDILAAIPRAFAGATEDDISLFYYSGHGYTDGSLFGSLPQKDGYYPDRLTPAALRDALNAIPGRKIVLIDACYSGQFIARGEGEAVSDDPEAFNQAFLAGFLTGGGESGLQGRSGELVAENYYVLTACAADQESFSSLYKKNTYFGIFTFDLMQAAGWNALAAQKTVMKGDTQGVDGNAPDGRLSLQEAYRTFSEYTFTVDKVKKKQNVQRWPEDKDIVLFGRKTWE